MARLWSVETGEVKREYSGHQKALVCLAFRDDVPDWSQKPQKFLPLRRWHTCDQGAGDGTPVLRLHSMDTACVVYCILKPQHCFCTNNVALLFWGVNPQRTDVVCCDWELLTELTVYDTNGAFIHFTLGPVTCTARNCSTVDDLSASRLHCLRLECKSLQSSSWKLAMVLKLRDCWWNLIWRYFSSGMDRVAVSMAEWWLSGFERAAFNHLESSLWLRNWIYFKEFKRTKQVKFCTPHTHTPSGCCWL